MSESLEARIARAKAYPFARHDHCFLYEDGATRPLEPGPCDLTGRVPVLAAGSNQSHEQLRRKYAAMAGTVIPVWRGRLHEFDVVYAAHLTGYGSVPATFQHSPGTDVTVFVTWLTGPQLERMHETEGNYTYDRLSRIRLALDRGGELTEAYVYSSKVGCLAHRGGCVAIAEIAAAGRRFPALGQTEMLGAVRDRFEPGVALDAFIAAQLTDEALRRDRSRRLGEGSLPLLYARETMRDGLGR
jgi:hypothetical protein